jgi:hypothetical protein
MSTNLTLIKYQLGVEGRYLEESGECIASSFIDEETLNDLIKVTPLAKLIIYEEEGTDEFSEADCFQNEQIYEALSFINNRIITLIRKTQLSDVENMDEELSKVISEFRSITSLYHLLEIKYEKYQSDETVVVKLG